MGINASDDDGNDNVDDVDMKIPVRENKPHERHTQCDKHMKNEYKYSRM